MKNFPFYRITVIVSMAVSFFLEIYFFKRKHRNHFSRDTQKKWETLLIKQAKQYKKTALHLEGLLIKLGQFLSTRADLLPEAFLNELKDLVDQVPPASKQKITQVLKDEWGEYDPSVLPHFDDIPEASASIGQVYKGQLPTGEMVAIKIQRPDIEKIIHTDFKAMRIVFWLAKRISSFGKKADLQALSREIVAVISDELNFNQELLNGDYFRRRYEDNPSLKIPIYYPELSTKRILVMEWIEGAKISDQAFMIKHHLDQKVIAKQLFEAFTKQLLFDGKFHADPHPGNILLQSDGTIVLIDFGMVGEITKEDAIYLRSLVIGVVTSDYTKVIDSLESLQFLLPNADRRVIKQAIKLSIDLYIKQQLNTSDPSFIESILRDLQELVNEQPIQLPARFAFLGRATSTFVGVLTLIDPSIDLIEIGKPLIRQWLKEKNEEEQTINQLLKNFHPFLPFTSKVEQWLEEPTLKRELLEQKYKQELEHHYFETNKRYAFLSSCLMTILAVAGYLFHFFALMYLFGLLAVISSFIFLRINTKHRQFLNTLFYKKKNNK